MAVHHLLLLVALSLIAASTAQTVPYTKPTNIPSVMPDACGDYEYLYIRYPGDCSKYIVCNRDHPRYVMSCPATLEFNYDLQICDYPENAKCDYDKTTTVG